MYIVYLLFIFRFSGGDNKPAEANYCFLLLRKQCPYAHLEILDLFLAATSLNASVQKIVDRQQPCVLEKKEQMG